MSGAFLALDKSLAGPLAQQRVPRRPSLSQTRGANRRFALCLG